MFEEEQVQEGERWEILKGRSPLRFPIVNE
jgi:hypothetical protein